jgi:penicillin-binding protein 1A
MRLWSALALIFVLITSLFLGSLFFIAQWPVVDFSVLENYSPAQGSILLDDKGEEWARFQYDRREMVSLAKMPPQLIHAFLAAEDHAFFTHSGISVRAIFRSLLVNIVHGRVVQGASTITQQLVKLLFTDSRRTFSRKIKEQFLALLVERQFSKEQILEIYLNHIYFGCGIYGVEAACQRFWGKHVHEITIDEAAILAGTIRSPGKYCPLLHPEHSIDLRNGILQSMLTLKYITKDEYKKAKAQEIKVQSLVESEPLASYFKEHIRMFLEDLVGKKSLYKDGLVIQTTLNKEMQRKAQEVFNSSFTQLKKTIHPEVNGGLITLEVSTGAIKAFIGGTSFVESPFNRVTQARRQMGSTFKPFVYAAAIDFGMGFDQVSIDEPISITDAVGTVWEPGNVTHTFTGPMTLALGLSRSNNILAIKTFLTVGAEKIIALAQDAGITGTINPYPSLALGCLECTVQESAAGFNIFANNGIYVKPHGIRWIKNKWGDKIWKYKPEAKRVLSSLVSGQVAKVLTISLEKAKLRQAAEERLTCEALGKSGTTNDARTCWFSGSTPDYTTTLYIGCDNNRSMGENILSVNTTYPLWHKFMRHVPVSKNHFSYDSNLKEVLINQYTGERTTYEDPFVLSILIDPKRWYPRFAPNPINVVSTEEKGDSCDA